MIAEARGPTDAVGSIESRGMSHAPELYPVILCSGTATHLWPVSRKAFPKQFTPLQGPMSPFQDTLRRLDGMACAAPVLMTTEDLRFIAAGQAQEAGFTPASIIVEPAERGTAPAIAVAAGLIVAQDPDALMLVMPSDHRIDDVVAFQASVSQAMLLAAEGALIAFGTVADRVEPRSCYVEVADPSDDAAEPILRIVEMPDDADAQNALERGRLLRQSGVFLFRAQTVLDALETHAPAVASAARAALAAGDAGADFTRLDAGTFGASPILSLEHAVMAAGQGLAVRLSCGWSDLGSWETVHQLGASDVHGVVADDASVAIDCENTLLRTEDPGVALLGIGLKDTIAVAMRDAVLVADMSRAEDVRAAVATLEARGFGQATTFPRCDRPWGWYETLLLGPRFQIKRIVVKPGGKLSLQSHVHRSEHWIVVDGSARVTVDDTVRLMRENDSIYIPLGAIHRLENPGKIDMTLIEVQSGSYLGEDDIVRYEDIYNRT